MPKHLIVEMRTPSRGVWWEVEQSSIREHFDECKGNGANPHLNDVTFEQYIRPLAPFNADNIDKYNGTDHFIFGEFETRGQSDSGPGQFLYPQFAEPETIDPTIIEVRWVE